MCIDQENNILLLIKVDFLDTAGDDQFPVMRRLSISSGMSIRKYGGEMKQISDILFSSCFSVGLLHHMSQFSSSCEHKVR